MRRSLLGMMMLCLGHGVAAVAGDLFTYQVPPALLYTNHDDDFTVQVRTPGGEWKDLYEWKVTVDLDQRQNASMVYFDFTGSVDLRIQKNNGTLAKITVGPLAGAPKAVVRDNKVYITLDRPQSFAVFFDDDHLHNLHVFAGAPVPVPNEPNVRRFGPGLHVPEGGGGTFEVHSGETIYMDGGAVMLGTFHVGSAQNVKILGHGLILAPAGDKGGQFLIEKSQKVTLEGPIVTQADGGVGRSVMSKDIRIADVKGITGGQWTDGINIYSSERVTLDRLFLRTSDDCVTVYAHRGESYGDSRDIRVTNSTLWADIAHAMFVGIHGNTINPETIERVTFDNIDVIDVDEDDPEFEGVMSILAGDSNLVRDITFSNIRVDRIEEAKLFNFRVGFNGKYNTSPGRGIRHVVLRNISYTGYGMPSASVIGGYDAQRSIDDVLLDNVTIGGRKIDMRDPEVVKVGPFATNVRSQ
jgi:hypothetical protein